MNISEIKEELQRLGISTSTPGLVGDERYEELKFRLEQVGRKANLSPGQKLEGQMKAVNSSQYDQFSQLTIGELRTRLTSLGISTSTPGVTGEERWSILMQRLMDAICVKTNDDEEEEDSDDDKPPNNKALEFIPPPKQPSRKPPTEPPKSPPKEEKPVEPDPVEVAEVEEERLAQIAQNEISELKKLIKRLGNKRSMYVASKLSGSSQDETLKALNEDLNDVEADYSRVKFAEDRGESFVKLNIMKVELLVPLSLGRSDQISLESAYTQLNEMRMQVKEHIKVCRQQIREEADAHPEFGLAAEEVLKQRMNVAVLANTKTHVSRTRKRIAESKMMDESISAAKSTSSTERQSSKPFDSTKDPIMKEKPSNLKEMEKSEAKSSSKTSPKMSNNALKVKSETSTASTSNETKKEKPIEQEELVSSFLGKGLNLFGENGSKERPSPKNSPNSAKPSSMVSNWSTILEGVNQGDESDENDDENHERQEKKEASDNLNSPINEPDAPAGNSSLSRTATRIVTGDGGVEELFHSPVTTSHSNHPVRENQQSLQPLSGPHDHQRIRELGGGGGDSDSESDGSHNKENEFDSDDLRQLKSLRTHAKKLEQLGDIQAAEILFERALELDPTDILTLQGFAVFLHKRKGELSRAEAFFNRALQICMPGIHSKLSTPKKKLSSEPSFSINFDSISLKSPSSVPGNTYDPKELEGFQIKSITKLLLSFANFMIKSKGDIEAAYILLDKAVSIDSNNGSSLAKFAHFLSEHRGADFLGLIKSQSTSDEFSRFIDQLFRNALKLQPGNVNQMLWYAKFLKRSGKLAPAELMYRSAMECSKGDPRLEPTALCNYATFLFKNRKNVDKAEELFQFGLDRYPLHKGLRKNFTHLLKAMAAKAEKDMITEESGKEDMDSFPLVPYQQNEGIPRTPKINHSENRLVLVSSAEKQSRGSIRAQRARDSLASKIPMDLESAEEKSKYIMKLFHEERENSSQH